MDVGVIGAGTMGKNHVRVYSELSNVDEVYIYDTNAALAKKVSEQYDAVICELDVLLKSVDAVSICVPTKYHFEVAKMAIEGGVHCLIEKPVAPTSKMGKELLKVAGDDLVVGVGHIERFNPIVEEIKKLLKKPRYMGIRRHNPTSSRINDTDVVTDLMVHDIDLVWNIFMDGKSYDLHSFGDDDLCNAIVRFDRCVVSLSASRIACKKMRSIYIEEDGFSVDGDFMNQDVYVYKRPQKYGEVGSRYVEESVVEKILVNKVEPLKEELRVFVECVKKEEQFPITLEQAVLSLEIAEKIKRAG